MSVAASVITDIFHFIKIILICVCFFRFSERKVKNKRVQFGIIFSSLVAVSVLVFYFLNPILDLIVYLTYITLVVLWLFDEQKGKLILSSLWIMFIIAVFDNMSEAIVRVVYDIAGISDNEFKFPITSFISLIYVSLLGNYFLKKYKYGLKEIDSYYLISFLLISAAGSLMCSFFTDEAMRMGNVYFLIVTSMLVICVFMLISIIVILHIKKAEVNEQAMLNKKYLNKQKEYYEYLKEKENDTRSFRHDVKNHIRLISDLLKKQKYDLVEDYIKRIDSELDKNENKVFLYNDIVDCIINQYYSNAQKLGVSMEVSGRFPMECAVEVYDICVVFSNILSNAIEAAAKSNEKIVKLECRYSKNGTIIIRIKNTYTGKVIIKDGKIITSKRDDSNHGYGLENVFTTAKRYNGWCNVYANNGEFKLDITLNTKSEER